MEFNNPDRKSLSELIKSEEFKDKQVVIIGAGNTGKGAVMLIEKLSKREDVVLIQVENLLEADQVLLNKKSEEPPKPKFEELVMKIEAPKIEALPEIFVEDKKKFNPRQDQGKKFFNSNKKVNLPKKNLGFRGRR